MYPSIIAFHNNFFGQIRRAFIIGSYYPALTAVCSLGERVLNHIIINVRDFYKFTKEYKRVHRKQSFDNRDLLIDTLESREILLPNVVNKFRDLKTFRNNSIHFKKYIDSNDRECALEAILCFQEIIKHQFSAF